MIDPSLRTLVNRINKIPTEILMNEFNLIKEKKSRLPRRQRDLVVLRIAYLIKNGMATDSTTTEAALPAQPV